jgi:hypothetical protein
MFRVFYLSETTSATATATATATGFLSFPSSVPYLGVPQEGQNL